MGIKAVATKERGHAHIFYAHTSHDCPCARRPDRYRLQANFIKSNFISSAGRCGYNECATGDLPLPERRDYSGVLVLDQITARNLGTAPRVNAIAATARA